MRLFRKKIHKTGIKNNIFRAISVVLTVTMIVPLLSVSVYAAAPTVTTDETLYGNLGAYGTVKDINIVKAVNLNGKTELTDYGNYETVENMTSKVEPSIEGDTVKFTGLDPNERFYYQCTLKADSLELPWTFDIAYKLNGVPIEAEKLVGASGLIEINVNATHNEKAERYFRNNMLLTVAMTADMDDDYSVDAPGAQIQTLGATTAIVFAALPGEDGDYTIRIGSDDFKTSGVMITMLPGTLDSLNKIKDIKEAKDTIKDSIDKVYTSTDKLMDVMDSFGSGLKGLHSGLEDLQRARSITDSYSDTLISQTNQTIVGLQDTAEKTAAMIPHIQTAQEAVSDISSDIDSVASMTDDVSSTLTSLASDLDDIESDIDDLQDVLSDADEDLNDTTDVMTDLYSKLTSTSAKLTVLKAIISGDSSTVLGTASNATGGVNNITSMTTSLTTLYKSLLGMGVYNDMASPSNAENMSDYYESLNGVTLSTTALYTALGALCDEGQDYITVTQDGLYTGKSAIGTIQDGIFVAQDTGDDTNEVINSSQDVLRGSRDLLDSIGDLNDTIQLYSSKSIEGLAAAQSLTESLSNDLVNSASTLTTINDIFKNSRSSLNSGTQKSLDASMDIIDKALTGLNVTDDLRDANSIIKKTWDDKISELEDDNNFLEIDPEAPKISFTSDKNVEPQSIQIILRSDEIDDEDIADDTSDIETDEKDIGPLNRMWNVFKDIFIYIVKVFKDL